MTPLPDYVPRPGELVEFKVPADAVAEAAQAPEHPAPPSYVQENHILRRLANKAAGRPQSPWLGIVFELPGKLDTGAMATALEKWVLRHRTLLTWFSAKEGAEGEKPLLQRREVPAELVSVQAVALGEQSADAIHTHITESFRDQTDPLVWPPFTAGAVVREDDTSTVFFAVDHAHTDGFSMILVFDELRSLYQAEVLGTKAELPEVGSYVDACVLDRERAAGIKADSPEVKSWIDFFLGGPLPSFPLDLGVPPGESRPSLSIELDLLTADEAVAFSEACKAHGASFSVGLLTALGIAGSELAGRPGYRGLAVVHTRDEPRWQFTQGWFINLVPVAFDVTEDGEPLTLGRILAGAKASYAEARKLAMVSPLRVAELIPGVSLGGDASTVLPMLSYIDLRHAPGSRDWEAADCNALVGPGPSSEVPVWINRLWDRTYLKTRYPDTPEARHNVPRYFEHLKHVLGEIAATGDYTLKPLKP
ncbi:condensation domain-containing protein [Streptomyces sp. NA04227]|uniref:condensation domain-containing protein n=1 Tax=Streptomyces sp. NA04227 TaxID=2742136 RepID=UPI0020CA7413|nr:condensation domain-containing protein [Streptomyces sp. NA04227]